MSNVSSANNAAPVLPIIGLADQQRDLRNNATKWKVAAAALAVIGAAVAAAAGVAFTVFKAIPLVALAGGIAAGVAILGLAILVYSKKVSSIMKPEQLLEALSNTALKPINEARALVKELDKLLPKGDKALPKEDLKKLTDKVNAHKNAQEAYQRLLSNNAKFDEEATKVIALARELESEEAKKFQDLKSGRVICDLLIDNSKVYGTDKDACEAQKKVLARLAPFAYADSQDCSEEASDVYRFVSQIII